MTFELPVTEEKVKGHQITALHLLPALAFIGAGAIFYWLYMPTRLWGILLMLGGVIILATAIFKNKWLIRTQANRVFRIIELMGLLCLISFMAMRHWWMPSAMFGMLAAAILFALYWEKSDNRLSIHVDDEGIKLPITSRRRFLEWTDVDSVLLRYGTLTIDCPDNRLFQWNIRQVDFDLTIFEAYCTSKIDESKSKRRKDDW